MQVIIDKPYQFVPPLESRLWGRIISWRVPAYLRRAHGIVGVEVRGVDRLAASRRAGSGVLLAPNHSHPADPIVMAVLGRRAGTPLFTMASWHLFMQSRRMTWVIRRMGAFSIYREGMDRAAVAAATDILVAAHRPLVIFPEGVISRTNDWLTDLMEGTAFIARSAARRRAKEAAAGRVVVHPVTLKYLFRGDVRAALDPVLSEIETRLSWRPQRELAMLDRIVKLGSALLGLKEMEYLGAPQSGTIDERVKRLIDALLDPLESEWLEGRREPQVIARVKKLRAAIVPDLVVGEIDEAERRRRWRQLADVYLAQRLSFFPADYIRSHPSVDRYLETVQRFNEALTDQPRPMHPTHVVIQVGEAIEVGPRRDRSDDGDPLMEQIRVNLQAMLDELANESAMV